MQAQPRQANPTHTHPLGQKPRAGRASCRRLRASSSWRVLKARCWSRRLRGTGGALMRARLWKKRWALWALLRASVSCATLACPAFMSSTPCACSCRPGRSLSRLSGLRALSTLCCGAAGALAYQRRLGQEGLRGLTMTQLGLPGTRRGKGEGGKERERVWGCEGTEACNSAPHPVAPEVVDAVTRQAVGLYLDLQGDVEAQDLVLGGQVEGLQQQALRPSIVVLVVQAARLVQQQLGICVVEKPAQGMAWVMLCAVGWGSRCTDVRSMRDKSKPAEHAHPRLPTSCTWHWRLQHRRVHRHVQPWDPHCATQNVGMA